MAIFNSYVSLPEGTHLGNLQPLDTGGWIPAERLRLYSLQGVLRLLHSYGSQGRWTAGHVALHFWGPKLLKNISYV